MARCEAPAAGQRRTGPARERTGKGHPVSSGTVSLQKRRYRPERHTRNLAREAPDSGRPLNCRLAGHRKTGNREALRCVALHACDATGDVPVSDGRQPALHADSRSTWMSWGRVRKRMASMIAAIGEGRCVRDMLCERGACQDETAERPRDIAIVCRRMVWRVAGAAGAIQGLIGRVVVTPGTWRFTASSSKGPGRERATHRGTECRSRWRREPSSIPVERVPSGVRAGHPIGMDDDAGSLDRLRVRPWRRRSVAALDGWRRRRIMGRRDGECG